MPWNCLCTSKKEKRPQISAPILEPHDKQIAIQPKIISTEQLEQRLNENNAPTAEATEIDETTVTGKKKKAKKAKVVDKKKKSKPPKSRDTEKNDEKLNQFTHVQFQFDDYSPPATNVTQQDSSARNALQEDAHVRDQVSHDVFNSAASISELKITEANDLNGNYDELPLIRLDDNQNLTTAILPLTRSSESIPFIDDGDSLSRSPRLNARFETRIITLIPKNFESHNLVTPTSPNRPLQSFLPVLHPRYQESPPKPPRAAQLRILPKIDERKDETHKFQYYYNPGYKVCQICHLYLHVCPAIKCFECEFVCHQQCFDKPNHRYADTSYLIHRQWKKGGPVLAFPHLVQYFPEEQGTRKSKKKTKSPPTFKIKDALGKNKTERNFKKRRSRRSMSDENETKEEPVKFEESTDIIEPIISSYTFLPAVPPPPPPPPLRRLPTPPPLPTLLSEQHVAKIDEVELFDTQLRIDEPGNTASSVIEFNEIEVNVDIHRSNSESEDESTVIEANNNSLKIDDQQLIAEGRDPGTVKERLEKLATELVIHEDDVDSRPRYDASMSVPIKRKQYIDLDIDSLSSETDLDDAESLARRMHSTQSLRNNYDEELQIVPKSRSSPVSTNDKRSNTLRLHYITERILASVLPARTISEATQRQNGHHCSIERGTPSIMGDEEYEDEHERELMLMLEQKHGKNYRVFDLESCLATITLEKLCELCKHIDAWLGSGREKVVVLQDRGDRQRLGSAIAAYLEYQQICGSTGALPSNKITTLTNNEDRQVQNQIVRNWLDLDIFSMRKFLEDMVGPLHVPSYKRYVDYFAGLLSGQVKMNSSSLHLNYVILESPPCLHYKAMTTENEWKSFIKIYEGQRCVFISDVYIVPITTKQFIYEIKHPLRLRGDVIIRCFQLVPNINLDSPRLAERELISSVQFHTCAITNTEMVFRKADLDFAYDDERFPNDHKITLIFINPVNPNDINRNFVFQNALVRVEPLSNCSSLDNLSEVSSHTHGPLDGSVYATILKSPKSFQSSPPKPLRTSTQSLISPPAEFSSSNFHNPKFTIDTPNSGKFYAPSTSTPTLIHGRNSENHYEDIKTIQERTSGRNTPTPSVISYASSSRHSQSRTPGVGALSKETYNEHLRVVESANGYDNAGEPRESVRSPLTLSMDSGISSSGVVNNRRGVQGSSVSPTSFPSQTSPQEDRHRELDDLLSDMLMTVQDIPDIGTSSKSKNQPTSTTQQKHLLVPNQTSTYGKNKSRELYESSSTHTLTPPPSESGRETPLTTRTPIQQRELELQQTERELIMSLSDQQQRSSDPQLSKMNIQHHLYLYPQQARIETLSITSDTEDDQIPYHAREDSRPFTYGNIPNQIASGQTIPASTSGKMIKMHSGLSSPSMVRKVIGGERKPQPRNEFEEMLLERREKILNDKYSIGDTKPNGGVTYENKWYNSTNGNAPQNGYHHDLLKRSNTMDGSFGRSPTPSDGTSGQTWLQLQQQKLRARREAQGRDVTDNYSRTFSSPVSFDTMHHSRRSQTLSPVRPERNYHTISKSTSISTEKERPFVSVKRAHQHAKQGFNSTPASPITALNAAPLGHVAHVKNAQNHDNVKNGLIMFSEEREHIERVERSPSRNGTQLETNNTASHMCNNKSNNNMNSSLSALNNTHNNHVLNNHHSRNNNHYPQENNLNTKNATDKSLFKEVASGQLTLDKLLASLALESNVNEQHLATINNNNNYTFAAVVKTMTKQLDMINGNHQHDDDLTAIIADLTEFGSSQSQTSSGAEDQWPMKDVSLPGFRNLMIKKLTESEYSSSVSPSSLSERSNGGVSWNDQAREESFSSHYSGNDDMLPRPETPAFPVTPRTPNGYASSPALPPKSPTTQRKDPFSRGGAVESYSHNELMSNYTSRRNSVTSNTNSEPQEVAPHHVKFVRDSSKYWYKANISREEAVNLLRHAQPGTFIVRDSTTFANAFGLVLKVAVPPKNVQQKGPPGDELVRHFLVEPTLRGVRLKGCSDEPVFSSLSALVYQHSITPLALPCRLIIPDRDTGSTDFQSPVQQQFLAQGAACNVFYLVSIDTESLTGPQAVRKAVSTLFSRRPLPTPTEVHFKVSQQGITLTDNTRRLFFRKHYPAHTISHCGLDPDEHRWSVQKLQNEIPVINHRIYAFVAKRTPTSQDNQCHVFCELDLNQPATAIVAFANRAILSGAYSQNPPRNI